MHFIGLKIIIIEKKASLSEPGPILQDLKSNFVPCQRARRWGRLAVSPRVHALGAWASPQRLRGLVYTRSALGAPRLSVLVVVFLWGYFCAGGGKSAGGYFIWCVISFSFF